MKRLLFIAFYYPPMGGGGITRPLKFTKYLPAFGWQPVVLTAKPHHYWFQDDHRLKDIPPESEIHHTPALTGIPLLRKIFRSSGTRDAQSMGRFRQWARWFLFPDPFAGWLPFALAEGLRICRKKNIDCILATAPPPVTFLIGSLLSKMCGIPLVLDYRDLWTEDLHFFPPTGFHRLLHRSAERWVLTQARASIVINERMKNRLTRAFPSFPEPFVIRSGYDPDDLRTLSSERSSPGEPFRFVHTGNLTLNRPIEGLLRALRELTDQQRLPPFEFHFYGQRDDHNDQLVRAYHPLPVYLHDPVTHEQSLALQSRADALLFIGYDTNEKADCVSTGKIYEYLYWALNHRKPILALTAECDAADLIHRTQTGYIAPLRDPELIKNALLRLFKPSVEMTPIPTQSDTYSFRRSAEQLAELLHRLA